jgi:RNA polymerase sigma factor (TIGR02999 family)
MGTHPEALNRIFVLVEDELRRVAHQRLAGERENHTLSTTALVHETYLKLAKQDQVGWTNRGQFFALAAQAMRRLLIDYARRHKHMRDRLRYDSIDAASDDRDASAVQVAAAQRSDELLALDDALERLAQHDERLSRVVECRFFAGFTEDETAEALGVTPRTVSRDWVKAKEWLRHALGDGVHDA